MAEKKTTKKVATKAATTAATKTTTAKAAPKKAAATKTTCKKIDLDQAGTNAGKVWVALNTSKKPMTLAEIAKATALCDTCAAIALGWLAREDKVKGADKFELYTYE